MSELADKDIKKSLVLHSVCSSGEVKTWRIFFKDPNQTSGDENYNWDEIIHYVGLITD